MRSYAVAVDRSGILSVHASTFGSTGDVEEDAGVVAEEGEGDDEVGGEAFERLMTSDVKVDDDDGADVGDTDDDEDDDEDDEDDEDEDEDEDEDGDEGDDDDDDDDDDGDDEDDEDDDNVEDDDDAKGGTKPTRLLGKGGGEGGREVDRVFLLGGFFVITSGPSSATISTGGVLIRDA